MYLIICHSVIAKGALLCTAQNKQQNRCIGLTAIGRLMLLDMFSCVQCCLQAVFGSCSRVGAVFMTVRQHDMV